MGNTKAFHHAPFQHYGNALMFFYDTTRTAWDSIGMIQNPRVTFDQQKQTKTHYVEGRRVEVASRVTSQTGMLEFDWVEHLNPRGNQRIYGDKTSTQTISAADVSYIDYEFEFYRNDDTDECYEHFVPYPTAQANYTRLGAFSAFLATVNATAGGSGWSTGGSPDYYAWAVPVHLMVAGTVPALATLCDSDKLDVTYTFGKPWDEDTSSSAYNGEPVDFTNATDEVTFTGTANTDMGSGIEPTPDYVAIFMNTTDDLATATCEAVGTYAAFTGAGITVSSLTPGDVFEHAVGATFWRESGASYSSSSLALMDMDGTDIVWDNTRGAAELGTDYTTQSAMTVKVRQAYVKSKSIVQSVGPTGTGNDYRKVAIVCLDNQEDGPSDKLYAEGDIVTLYRVDFAAVDGSLNWSEDDWVAPISVSAPVLADPSNSNEFGTREIWSPALRSLATQYYR